MLKHKYAWMFDEMYITAPTWYFQAHDKFAVFISD